MGRRHQRAPQGHVRPVPLGRRPLARAGQGRPAGERPDHQHDVGVGHLRQPGPDQLRRGQGRHRRLHRHRRDGGRPLRRHGQRRGAGGPHPDDGGPRCRRRRRRTSARPARRRWIAPIVTWLASEQSAGVTGQVFEASGQFLAIAEGWIRGPSDRPGRRPDAARRRRRQAARRHPSQRRDGRPSRLLAAAAASRNERNEQRCR